MQDIATIQELLEVRAAIDTAIEDVAADLAGLGFTDNEACPWLAFATWNTAAEALTALLDDATEALELAGAGRSAEIPYSGYLDLVASYGQDVEDFQDQLEEFFDLLDFDIEEVLVEMPPMCKDRLDDEDAVIYQAFDLDEMSEPWRNLVLIAQERISEKLEVVDALVQRLLELLVGEEDEDGFEGD